MKLGVDIPSETELATIVGLEITPTHAALPFGTPLTIWAKGRQDSGLAASAWRPLPRKMVRVASLGDLLPSHIPGFETGNVHALIERKPRDRSERPEPGTSPGSDPAAVAVRKVTIEQTIGAEARNQVRDAARRGLIGQQAGEAIDQFYAGRNNAPLWVSRKGPNARARAVIAEVRRAGNYGLKSSDFDLPRLQIGKAVAKLAKAEVKLTLAILKYARHAYGHRINPRRLSPSIDRSARPINPQRVLHDIARADLLKRYLRSLHPQHVQFDALRRQYLRLRSDPAHAATVQILLVNMERWRWYPRDLGRFHVWLNIPEYIVRVIDRNRVVHSERSVVGKRKTKTPDFSDWMEEIVFHPTWNVPDSIKVEEIIPALRRGSPILARQNLGIRYNGRAINPYSVDWRRSDVRRFHFYQPPGRRNVLGFVKFMFPNKHAVYMHDTPSKQLFKQQIRTYSHGCMRIRNPRRLAEVLLAQDKGWRPHHIAALINAGITHPVQLTRKIPVHITYLTARVDRDGRLEVYGDIYGHDRRLANALTGRGDLIAAVAGPEASEHQPVTSLTPAQLARRGPSYSAAPYWSQQALEGE